MKKRMLLAAGMLAAALLLNGCVAEEGTSQKAEEMESTSVKMDSEAESINNAEKSFEETVEENTAAISENAESQIQPAATRQEALDIYDKAFTEHDFAYLLAACIEPYGHHKM